MHVHNKKMQRDSVSQQGLESTFSPWYSVKVYCQKGAALTVYNAAVNSRGTFPPSNVAPAHHLPCETTSFCHDSLKTSPDSITTLAEVLRGCLEKLKVAVPLDCAERKERSKYVRRVATEIYQLSGNGECVQREDDGVPENDADVVLMGWKVTGYALNTKNYYMSMLEKDDAKQWSE